MKSSNLFFAVFVLFLCSIFCTVQAEDLEKTFSIAGTHFQTRIEGSDPESDSDRQILHLLRRQKGKSKDVLTHTLLEADGDCNSFILQLGDYEIRGTQIIFYSYWANGGDAPTSYDGVQKQVYDVDARGRLKLNQSLLFIDSGPRSDENQASDFGSDYLEKTDLTAEERHALKKYTQMIEKNFHGQFVLGEAAQALQAEVRAKLKAQIAVHTDNWEQMLTGSFGIRK